MPLRRNRRACKNGAKRTQTDKLRGMGGVSSFGFPCGLRQIPPRLGFVSAGFLFCQAESTRITFQAGLCFGSGFVCICAGHMKILGGDFHMLSVACRSSWSARRDHGRGQTPGGSAFCRFRCGRSSLSGGFRGDCTGGLHPALSLWYNSSWRPFVVDVLILHHVFYHDCRRLCNIYPARHPPGGGLYTFFPFASATDPSPFSLSLSTRRNDLSRVSHDRMHFSNLPSCFSSPETSVDMV